MNILIKLIVKLSPLDILLASVAEMGWGVSICDKQNDDDLIQGLVVGTHEFMDEHSCE